jgi:TonB family protein
MLATWVVDCLLKVTFILGVTWALAAILRSRAASLRHLVWTLGLASVLLLPAAWQILPVWTVSVGRSQPLQPTIDAMRPVISSAAIAGRTEQTTRAIPWAALLWGFGCAMVILRWTSGALRTRRLVRRTSSATYSVAVMDELRVQAGLSREVRVVECADSAVALVWGLLRPVVVLPAEAASWAHERLRTVLLHELAHVQRRDPATQLLAQIATAVYWLHPLVWLAYRRLRQERARACDDIVLSEGISGAEYAGHLIDLVRRLAAHPRADAPAMAEARDLELRVRAVLNPKQRRRSGGRKMLTVMTSVAMALVLAVASFRAVAQEPTSSLSGTMEDASGARIPEAKVTARKLDTGIEVVAVADPIGRYSFATLPAGSYLLQFSAPGFSAHESRVVVSAQRSTRQDVMLNMGGLTESVTISARGNPIPEPLQRVRVKVGGMVQPSKALATPSPIYPDSLKERGVHGSVVLRAVIGKEGQVLSPRVVNYNEVDPELAEIAVQTIRSWTYTPALLNGEPVETVTTVTMNFELVP